MLLLLAAVVLSCVGVSTPSHCGVDPLPTNPEPDNVCSVYYNCTANAGENITIPCGAHQERSGVSFTYDIHYHNDERKILEQVTTEFLIIPLTAVEDRSYVSCTPNNSMESSCYGLDIFYRPQEVPPVTIHQGQRNAHYCLSCQIKANPTPNCSWTIYTTEMGPYQCERNGTCPTVDPPGVTFPDSPREVCPMNQVPLPLPVYPGCVMEIDRLTPEYRYYQYICTAENALGIHNVNFGYRPIPFILCGGQDVTVQLTSTTPGVNVTIGDSETLDCRVTNVEPGGDILWYHNGTDLGYIQSIYSSETCILQSMLVLSNVTYADGGTYTCLFRDNVVSATESSTLFVRVNPRDQPASSTDSKKTSIYVIAGTCGGVVLIVLFLVLFLVVVMYKSSKSIQFFLKWRLKEPEYAYIMNGKRVAFEYDVFLSFAEEDKKDVEEGLRNPLEKKGYHVCWHHTDFLAGRQITDNIEGNITASRKTIVVLSSDFYNSPHCRRELDFALQKLKNTKTYCVVPVLLRECGKLSSDITALTYLDATNNGRGERLINRLCDSLGKPKKDVPGSTLLVQASQ